MKHLTRWLAVLLLAGNILAATATTISVEDAQGRKVTLQQPAQRIVALAPHIVENLFSAGAGARLVGVVSYSDWPPAARSIPEVGSFTAFSLEQIAALQPDLVVMWGSGNGPRALEKLLRLSLPVYVSELRSLADIPQEIRQLGRLAGSEEHAEREAQRLEHGFDELAARYSGRDRLPVFYQIWHEPLQTINGEHLINEVLELCGGNNLFSDARGLAPRISLESVLAMNPRAIIAGGMDSQHPEWLDFWRQFPQLQAVSKDSLLSIHPDLMQRPTARLLEGARQLCSALDAVRAGNRFSSAAERPAGPPQAP